MGPLSAIRQRLWEAMESCRAASDDLSDPQFAELAARLVADPELHEQFVRLQEADEAIKTAFADVPVPAGLAERVSRRLGEGAAGSSSAPSQGAACDFAAPAATTTDSPAPLRESTSRFSRRRLLVGFTALSAAAALLAAVWIQTHLPSHETPSSVLEEAKDFFGKDNSPPGRLISQVPPPAEYPMSRDIVPLPGVRWRPVERFLGGPAVAYDLPTVAGRATLYVVQRNVAVPGLPAMPPPGPSLSTGGYSAAAWQTGNMLFVLVVEGDARRYSTYLDQSHGPLT